MKYRFTVTGLDCPNCAAKLASIIEGKDGIDTVKINFLTEKITVESSLAEDDVLVIASKAAHAFSRDVKIAK